MCVAGVASARVRVLLWCGNSDCSMRESEHVTLVFRPSPNLCPHLSLLSFPGHTLAR